MLSRWRGMRSWSCWNLFMLHRNQLSCSLQRFQLASFDWNKVQWYIWKFCRVSIVSEDQFLSSVKSRFLKALQLCSSHRSSVGCHLCILLSGTVFFFPVFVSEHSDYYLKNWWCLPLRRSLKVFFFITYVRMWYIWCWLWSLLSVVSELQLRLVDCPILTFVGKYRKLCWKIEGVAYLSFTENNWSVFDLTK